MRRMAAHQWAMAAWQLSVAAVAYYGFESTTSPLVAIPCIAVIFCQPYLMGLWIALGGILSPWRLVIVATLLTGLTWAQNPHVPNLRAAIAVSSPGIIVTLTILLLAGTIGFRLDQYWNHPRVDHSRKLQFTLWSVLEWTTAIAILFSLAALVSPSVRADIGKVGWPAALPVIVVHLIVAGICLGELAVLLMVRQPAIGIAVFMAIVLLFATFLGALSDQIVGTVVAAFCFTLWFALSTVPLRLLGYRIVWRRPFRQSDTSQSAAQEAERPIAAPSTQSTT
jgi:hypothetical protein